MWTMKSSPTNLMATKGLPNVPLPSSLRHRTTHTPSRIFTPFLTHSLTHPPPPTRGTQHSGRPHNNDPPPGLPEPKPCHTTTWSGNPSPSRSWPSTIHPGRPGGGVMRADPPGGGTGGRGEGARSLGPPSGEGRPYSARTSKRQPPPSGPPGGPAGLRRHGRKAPAPPSRPVSNGNERGRGGGR